MRTVVKHLRFMSAQWKVNLASAMAYRTTFLMQSIFMFFNDFFLLFLWWVLLSNFPSIAGWKIGEILLMDGLSAAGFGLVSLFAGNALHLARLISEGQLDYYLALPKNVLLHTLISRTQFDGIGDLTFGLLMGAVGCYVTGASYLLCLLLMLLGACSFAGFLVIVQSLSFFIGRSEEFSEQISMSVVTFGMYPGGIFQGFARFLIFFVIPAGFMVHLPVEILRVFSWAGMLEVVVAAVVIWALAILVFRAGLRRYESGNQVTLRG